MQTFRNNSRKLWKTLNEITNKVNDKSSLADHFSINGNNITDPLNISNEICKFFTNVGKNFASKIPKSHKEFDKYLDKYYTHSFFFQLYRRG